MRSVEVFDPRSCEWKLLSEMKNARRGCSAICLHDVLYVVGGFDGEHYIHEVEIYNIKTGKWSLGPSLSEGRFLGNTIKCPFNNGFYFIGG